VGLPSRVGVARFVQQVRHGLLSCLVQARSTKLSAPCGIPLPELDDWTQMWCRWCALGLPCSSSYLTAPPSPRTLPSSRGRSSRCCGWRCPYRCSAGCRLPWAQPVGTAARTGSWPRTPGRKVRVCPVCPAVFARAPEEEEEVLAGGSPTLSTHASVGEGLEPTSQVWRQCGGWWMSCWRTTRARRVRRRARRWPWRSVTCRAARPRRWWR
jgi:hypothetical protein